MDKSDKIFCIFFIILFSVVFILLSDIVYSYFNTETITIEGEVTAVVPVVNENGNVDYFIVTFDNGKSYNIWTNEKDFTVSSKIIIEIHNSNHFLFPNENKIWYINKFVKAPGDI